MKISHLDLVGSNTTTSLTLAGRWFVSRANCTHISLLDESTAMSFRAIEVPSTRPIQSKYVASTFTMYDNIYPISRLPLVLLILMVFWPSLIYFITHLT